MATMAVQAPAARLDASRAARLDVPRARPRAVPAPARRAGGPRARDVRRPAWLGDWMRDNFGGDEKKDGEKKDGESSRRVRRDGEGANGRTNGEKARRGLDPDLFAGAERVAAIPSGDRAGAAGKSRRGGDDERTGVRSREAVNRQRAEAAAARARRTKATSGTPEKAFDELTPAELRPDFGLRRDLYDLYEVKSLDDEDPIGSGSYGIVRRVVRKSDGKQFALKTIRKAPWRQPPTSRTSVQYYHSKLRNELDVMRKIGSSLSVVYLYDSFEDNDAVHLLMDLCEGGELLSGIRRGRSYTEADAAELVRSVLRTAAQCHSRGIIFRDIKPDNFLFERDEPGSPLKATDFGLAGIIAPGERLTRRCGTPSYMAPEVINRNYGEEADVWSCGVVAYQLLTGRLPFVDKVNQRPNAKEVFRAILEDPADFSSDPWPRLSDDCRDLVMRLMERDPERRVTARAALLHPWLQQTAAEAEQPIGGQVVARLQRFSTYGLLKRSVLRLLGDQLRKDSSSQDSGDEVNSSGDVTGEYLDTSAMLDPTVGDDAAPVSGVLAEELERTSEFLELFDLLDTSGDALVEPEELEAGLRRVGYSITADECAQLLAQLDTTNDGFIDVNEFLAALVDWEALEKSSTEYPNWVAQAFNMLDKDGSGTIDAEEVAELVFMNGDEGELTAEAKKTVAACIVEADTDGDGLIDLDEFITLLQMDPTDQLDAYEWRVKENESETARLEQAAVEVER